MGELDDLRGTGWRRLLAAARRRLDKTGGELIGTVGLADPSGEEWRVVDQITDRYRAARVKRVVVGMADLDGAIRCRHGVGLRTALARLAAPPQSPADAATAVRAALGGRHTRQGWFTAWLGEMSRDGTVARLVRQGDGHLVGLAAMVLDRLPGRDLPLPLLAEWATGDATALTGTPLADLVLRALMLWQGAPPPYDRAAEHLIWADAGVVADDLSSQVLMLNVRVREDHVIAHWLDDAASAGMPVRLTLQQVLAAPLTPVAKQIRVCASPAVVRAASAALAADCTPLVCVEGRVSVACHRLLAAAVRTGARIHWHGDFDWTGLRMTEAAIHRYGARPWRMTAADYLGAPGSDRLDGVPATASWDERLAPEMARERRAVREERLLPELLADLRAVRRTDPDRTGTPPDLPGAIVTGTPRHKPGAAVTGLPATSPARS